MKDHFGQAITLNISSSIWQALLKRCKQTGETPNHIINDALATELDIEHHTIFQVSTSTALVQGVYNGCVTIADIKKHGNFGLGTFDELDGEGIMLDGEVWQAKSDGSLSKAPNSATSPFWVTTNFAPKITFKCSSVSSWDDLCQQIDQQRQSPNIFTAICVSGVFDYVQFRVACRTTSGTDLVTATNNQAVFELNNYKGTLVGFWTPVYAKTMNVPGYHLHLLTDDHKHGGHVLAISGKNLTVQLNEENNFQIALPETADFLQANLSIDPSQALAKAEGAKRK